MADRLSTGATRRRFFANLAAATGGALSAAGVSRAEQGMGSMAPADRLVKAQQLRNRAADYAKGLGVPPQPTNGDEERYPDLINTFSKTLRHNHLGVVEPESFRSMRRALASGNNDDFDAILRGGNVRLKNPMAAFTYQFAGADPCQFAMRAAPRFDSAEQAGEMVEVYWHAHLRDVPFADYGSNPLALQAAAELSRLSDFRGPKENGRVTPGTLFRGNAPGDLAGPYVSQFLLLPAATGSQVFDQKQRSLQPGRDFMTTHADWLEIQLGQGKGAGVKYEATPRYIQTGRDTANYVHLDFGYSPYYAAVWKLLSYGDLIYDESNPYVWSRSQDSFVNHGPIDALDFIARAVKPAFNAAWWQKWMVHLRARPEVFAGRIHFHKLGNAVYPIHPEVLDSEALDLSFRNYGTYFLSQAYSEGSPAHSAFPSGHATVAGATVTMMKAFFREDYVIPDPVVPSRDGLTLEPWTGESLTVGGELNKMASNIALGRDFAGIHWRTDGWDGMLLGEQVALALLRDIASSYAEDFGGFELTRFNGQRVKVCATC